MRSIGVNRAVFFGVLSKVWLALAGLVTIFLIASYFSPEMQGYYFTFYSLLAMQVFVELGLGVVIVNFTSHEWSKLKYDKEKGIIGDKTALSRLKSLASIVFKWYAFGGLLLALILGLLGYLFFSYSHPVLGVKWAYPWFSLCMLTGLNLAFLPAFSLLEGSNQVSQIYFYRFIQEIVRSIFTWIIILLGGALWAPAGSTLFMLIWAVIFLYRNYANYFRSLLRQIAGPIIDWRNEIWPMQWRIGVSWLSGYFFFSLFTPVLFHFQGPVAAGQMGMTWSVVNALSMVASMWIITRAPQFGIYIAKKEYKELDRLIFASAVSSLAVATLGAAFVFGLILILNVYQFPLAIRLLAPLPTILFLVSTVLMQISYAQSTYLRAHKQEPFVRMSVISAVLMIVLVLVGGSRWGALGVSAAYFIVVVLFGLPYGTIIWLRCRKDWHADKVADVLGFDQRGVVN